MQARRAFRPRRRVAPASRTGRLPAGRPPRPCRRPTPRRARRTWWRRPVEAACDPTSRCRGDARASAAIASPHSCRSARITPSARDADQHQRGVEDVLTGRAEMHRAAPHQRRLASRPAREARRRAGSPDCRRPPNGGPARHGSMRRTASQAAPISRAAGRSISPARAHARASAVSASHSASMIAASSVAARRRSCRRRRRTAHRRRVS